jgi:hypothetical protein
MAHKDPTGDSEKLKRIVKILRFVIVLSASLPQSGISAAESDSVAASTADSTSKNTACFQSLRESDLLKSICCFDGLRASHHRRSLEIIGKILKDPAFRQEVEKARSEIRGIGHYSESFFDSVMADAYHAVIVEQVRMNGTGRSEDIDLDVRFKNLELLQTVQKELQYDFVHHQLTEAMKHDGAGAGQKLIYKSSINSLNFTAIDVPTLYREADDTTLFSSKFGLIATGMGYGICGGILFSAAIGGVAALFSKKENRTRNFWSWSIGTGAFCGLIVITYPFVTSPVQGRYVKINGKWTTINALGLLKGGDESWILPLD